MAALTTAEFVARLSEIKTHLDDLMKLNSKVSTLKKGHRLEVAGKMIGRKEVNSLKTQLKKEISDLKGAYVDQGKKKPSRAPRDPLKKSPGGFGNPILISDELKTFFANSQPSLNQYITAGQNGVTTSAIMTTAFNIYANANNIKTGNLVRSTPEMVQYLGRTLGALEALPATVSEKTGKTNPRFVRDGFVLSRFNSIVKENTVPKASLDAQTLSVLEQSRPSLEQQQRQVSDVLISQNAEKLAGEKGITAGEALQLLRDKKVNKLAKKIVEYDAWTLHKLQKIPLAEATARQSLPAAQQRARVHLGF